MARAAPFAFLFPALAAGVWLASQFPLPWWLSASVALASLLAMSALRAQAVRAWVAGLVLVFACGALRYMLSVPVPDADSVADANGRTVVIEGVVVEEPDTRVNYTGLRVEVRRLLVKSTYRPAAGLVLVRADLSIRWQYGDTVRAFGVLEKPPVLAEFDYRAYLARTGIRAWMPYPDTLQRLGQNQGDPVYAAILHVKGALRLSSQQVMPSPESALLTGILIGDDNELPASITEAFRRTGTSHIISISGFNVSIVIALVMPALSRVLNKRRAALVAIPAIAVYMLLVGASASVVRAGFMAILALIGQLFWRRGFTLNTLCAAAFIMLLIEPETLFDGGFQLSFAATLGLVLYADRIARGVQTWLERRSNRARAHKWTGALADVLLMTLAAQITTLPLILANFRQLSLVALIANGLVLPLQPAAMILGMTGSLAGLLSSAIGAVAALPAYALLTATLRIVEWAGSLSWASIPVYDFGALAAIGFYLLLFAFTAVITQSPQVRRDLAGFMRKALPARIALLAVLIVAVVAGVLWFQRPDGKLHVALTGVGAFIQTPGGRQIVYAGGGGVLPVMGRAMPLWDNGIELVMLPQRNDFARANTLPILQRYAVGAVILPDGEDEPSSTLSEWQAVARTKAGRVVAAPPGTRVVVEPGITLTVEQRARGAIGARLSYGDIVFEFAGESGIISGTLASGSVVFVAPKAASPDALNTSAPRWVAWADAGGMPARLSDTIRVVNLADVGAVEYISDGASLTLKTVR